MPQPHQLERANGYSRVLIGILAAIVAGGTLGLLAWILVTVRSTELTAAEVRGQMTTMVASLAQLSARLSLVETEQLNRAMPMAEFKTELANIARRLDKIESKLP